MSNLLPPDLQNPQRPVARPRQPGGGIGSAAPENRIAAEARSQAMGVPSETEREAAETVANKAQESDVLVVCPNPTCAMKLEPAWTFCPRCGDDILGKNDPARRLGIALTEEDVESYVFRGFVIRDLPLFGKYKVTARTSIAKDMKAIDKYLMTYVEKEEKKVSGAVLQNLNQLCIAATAVQSLNGEPVGGKDQSLESKVAWLLERGSAFVDMVSDRVILFNRAVTLHLRKESTLKGF